MFLWHNFKEASPKTRWFVINVILFSIVILASIIYPYVRFYTAPTRFPIQENHSK